MKPSSHNDQLSKPGAVSGPLKVIDLLLQLGAANVKMFFLELEVRYLRFKFCVLSRNRLILSAKVRALLLKRSDALVGKRDALAKPSRRAVFIEQVDEPSDHKGDSAKETTA